MCGVEGTGGGGEAGVEAFVPTLVWPDAPTRLAVVLPHAGVVTDAGRVACWGSDRQMVLGEFCDAPVPERFEDRFVATPVFVPGVVDAEDVAIAGQSTCARTRTSEVWCWGRTDGACEFERPTLLPDVRVRSLSGGVRNTQGYCGLGEDGDVWCWGPSVPTQRIEGLRGATAVSVGTFGVCALVDARIECFLTNDPAPRTVLGFDGTAVDVLAELLDGVCVLDAEGAVHCTAAMAQSHN